MKNNNNSNEKIIVRLKMTCRFIENKVKEVCSIYKASLFGSVTQHDIILIVLMGKLQFIYVFD